MQSVFWAGSPGHAKVDTRVRGSSQAVAQATQNVVTWRVTRQVSVNYLVPVNQRIQQGSSPKKEVGGRLKQDLDKNYLTLRFSK